MLDIRNMLALALLIAAAGLAGLSVAPALADEPVAPAEGEAMQQADPLAPLESMLGRWEGTGQSSMGPFTASFTTVRAGNWLRSDCQIFDMEGNVVETMTQLHGIEPDGTLVSYSFDSFGMTEMRGTATAEGGSLRWEEGEAWATVEWTYNADGSISSTFKRVDPNAPAPFNDFWVTETDVRVGDA
jgi:hypothetical protein